MDVFVAHAGADDEVAFAIRDALVPLGYEVFVYQDNLAPGPHHETTDAILNSGPLLVLVASEAAADSRHVRREVRIALDLDLPRVLVYHDLDPQVRDPEVRTSLGLMGEVGVVVEGEITPDQVARVVDVVRGVRPPPVRATAASAGIVGRDEDVRRLVELASGDDRRIVNVHGAPGVGKSTIAGFVAELVQHRGLADGVTTVPLDRSRRDPDAIAHLVASALDLDTGGLADPKVVDAVAHELARRGPLLLVVENLEHVTAGAEDMLVEWVRLAPQVRVITTSTRTFTNPSPLVSEYPLRPLGLPAGDVDALDVADLERASSVQLFLSLLPELTELPRVQRAVERDATSLREVARLCAVLGGFPSPIRMAAKRFSLKGTELRKMTRQYEDFLEAHPDEPDDRQFVYAATRAQLDLLPERTRLAFYQCAQLDGAVGDETAEALFLDHRPRDVDRTLEQLVAYHLLEVEGPDRYAPARPIRQYGRSVWEAETTDEQRSEHERRLIEHFVELARAAIDLDGDAQDRDEALAAVDLDRDCLLQVERALGDDGVARAEVALALGPSLLRRGPQSVLTSVVPGALDALGDERDDLRAQLLAVAAEARWSYGEYDAALARSADAVAAAEGLGDERVYARALIVHCRNLVHTGHDEEVPALAGAALERLEGHEELVGDLVLGLLTAASIEKTGQVEQALRMLDRAEALADEHLPPDDFLQGRIANQRGMVLWHDGRPGPAVEAFEAARRTFVVQQSEKWEAGATTNVALALADRAREDVDDALRLCETAEVMHRHAENHGWALVNEVAKTQVLHLAGRRDQARALVESLRRDPMIDQYPENRALLACIDAELAWSDDRGAARDELAAARSALEASGGALLLRRFRIGVALADACHAAGDDDRARVELDDLDQVRKVRRINHRHPVWHIVEANERYLDLKEALLDGDH